MPWPDHLHPILVGREITIRPSGEADLDLLTGWFGDPEVYRWWGGAPLTREEVARKYVGLRCGEVESFVIEIGGRDAGYIQYHHDGPGDGGLDMMLLPGFRDRGLGPRVARLLIDHLVEHRHWREITVDPAQDNARAIRAWEKAGFAIEREWPDHPDGPALLMRLRVDRAPGGFAAPR